jgi:hypothetical protein
MLDKISLDVTKWEQTKASGSNTDTAGVYLAALNPKKEEITLALSDCMMRKATPPPPPPPPPPPVDPTPGAGSIEHPATPGAGSSDPGSAQVGTPAAEVKPSSPAPVTAPTTKPDMKKWLLIGAGVLLVAGGIYYIAKK